MNMIKASTMCIVVVVLALTVTCSQAGSLRRRREVNDTLIPRIYGGDYPDRGHYRYAVSLNGCGGTLISAQWVVTAAHCIPRAEVVYGTHNLEGRSGHRCRVERSITHPRYNRTNLQYDVALVKLACTVQPDRDTGFVRLASRSTRDLRLTDGLTVWVAGWGRLENGRQSERLKHVQLSTVNSTRCRQLTRAYIDSSMMCAYSDRGDSCNGDSGGPLVYHDGNGYVLVGVVSFGVGSCGQANTPSGFHYIPESIDWIREQTGIQQSNNNNNTLQESGLRCQRSERLFNHYAVHLNINLAECARRCVRSSECGAVSWLSSTDNNEWRSFQQANNAQQACFYFKTGQYTSRRGDLFTSCFKR